MKGVKWVVSIISDKKVQIKNQKTSRSCEFDADQVMTVYFEARNVIVLEGGNAVQNYILLVDGTSCKLAEKKFLNIETSKKRKKTFDMLKICEL